MPRTVPRFSVRVPWYRRLGPVRRVHPDVVAAAVVVQETAVGTQMPLELAPVHAERRVVASLRSSFTREARKARTASRAMRKASSIVSPSVTSSGSRGLVTTNPPSSAGVNVRTSLPSETVYALATTGACAPPPRRSRQPATTDARYRLVVQRRVPGIPRERYERVVRR